MFLFSLVFLTFPPQIIFTLNTQLVRETVYKSVLFLTGTVENMPEDDGNNGDTKKTKVKLLRGKLGHLCICGYHTCIFSQNMTSS